MTIHLSPGEPERAFLYERAREAQRRYEHSQRTVSDLREFRRVRAAILAELRALDAQGE